MKAFIYEPSEARLSIGLFSMPYSGNQNSVIYNGENYPVITYSTPS
jgi:hypothetical protein